MSRARSSRPLEEAVVDRAWGELVAVGLVYVVGLGAGLLSLVFLLTPPSIERAGRASDQGHGGRRVALTPDPGQALRLGMTIAVGIGLHLLPEVSRSGRPPTQTRSRSRSARGRLRAPQRHRGFGIVGPLAGAGVQATVRGWLLVAGLVAGGPAFLGTIVGSSFSSEYVFVGFLALAAGDPVRDRRAVRERPAPCRGFSRCRGCSAAFCWALRPISSST